MTYEDIWEYVYAHFDMNQYFSAEELLYDVENMFNKSDSYFPPEARDIVRERFQYRREYAEMQARQDEQKQIADFIGGGQMMESITDEIVDDLKSPRSEIMDIDMTEYATTKESVIPPDIQKFVYKNPSFFTKVVNRFVGIFRRK